MNTTGLAPIDSDPSPVPRPGFWQRRVVRPILAQLSQGMTPDRIAATLGIGAACSLFPFFGFTTVLNVGAGFAFRLNHPILQTINQLLGPLQLALIVGYVRLGEVMWRATDDRFTVQQVLGTFRDASFAEFLQRFGWAGVHAFTAWLVTAPLLVAAVFFAFRPLLRRAVKRGAA